VIVRAPGTQDPRRLTEPVERAQRELSGTGVRLAAQRLFIHVNTAHHRLTRIEERTGCDLRDLAGVQELLIAIRLARHPIRTTTAGP
jgi:hypothetical protein